ncbi:hypothetical protein I6E29_02125 [Arcanobacterium haemolyticum]|nr:hypothetical protein [Arcanobacterium haemolyticum]
MDDAQIEAIEGEADVAYNSELAHTAAQALVPMGRHHAEDDPDTVARILALVEDEGVDVLAESWVRSPEDTLPGVLWRGYLLREWIRRYSDDVTSRFDMARAFYQEQGGDGEAKIAMTPSAEAVRALWDGVFAGGFSGEFTDVLTKSARFVDFIASVRTVWITDDRHPLATEVTRRDEALARTGCELREAARLASMGALE